MNIPTDTADTQQPEKKGDKKQITLERLRIALEKLQLTRAKTGITFLVLGFTFYRFFFSRAEAGLKPLLDFPNGRDVGIVLIFVGFVALLLGTLQHRQSIAKLKRMYAEMHYSVSLLLSYFILFLSLFLLFIVIFEL